MDFAANTALPNCAVARDRRKPLLQLVEGVPRGRQAAAWMFAAMRRASSRVSRLAAALFRLPPVQIGVACFSKMTLANTGPQSRYGPGAAGKDKAVVTCTVRAASQVV